MRRAAKIDSNQPLIVSALRKVGAHVTSLAAVGCGCPDLLVSHRNRWFLLEVKDPAKPPSARTLTPDQAAWHAAARGPVSVVLTAEDAVGLVCGAAAMEDDWK